MLFCSFHFLRPLCIQSAWYVLESGPQRLLRQPQFPYRLQIPLGEVRAWKLNMPKGLNTSSGAGHVVTKLHV